MSKFASKQRFTESTAKPFYGWLVFFFLILAALQILKIPGSIVFLFLIILIISTFIPSEYSLQKIAISAVFVIGLSPSYLLARGFITDSKLNKADLFLYGFLAILFLGFILGFRSQKLNTFKSVTTHLKKSLFGFAGILFGLSLETYLMRKSLGHGVAWISSGDSKNHLVAASDLVNYGDLLPSTFLTQPINLPSTLSLLLSQIGNDLSTNSSKLVPQITTYAYFWTFLIGITGIAFAACGQIFWGKNENTSPKFSIFLLSIVPFFSLTLGPSLNDGFFTAMFGITTVTVLTSWLLELSQESNPPKLYLGMGLLIFLATLMSWMFVTAVTLPILILGIWHFSRKKIQNYRVVEIGIVSFLFVGLLLAHFTSFGQSFQQKVKIVLTANGAVTASHPGLYYALIFLVAIIGLTVFKQSSISTILISLSGIHLVALTLFKIFDHVGIFSWNYYLLKYQWVLAVTLFALVSALFLISIERNLKHSGWQKIVTVGFGFLTLFAVSESVLPSSIDKVIPKIIRGWENPRSSIMDFALEQELDYKNPTMFFHYGYAGDARLANFWMNAFSNPQDPIRGWNYTIDTAGAVKQICEVNAYYPKVTIVTSDMKLEQDIADYCPKEEFTIKLVPPAF